MSYYTKYRPQTIAELDLLTVRTSLQQILSSGKFSHAYLFSGPKGTGKTSSARILAKVLNCEKNRNKTQATRHKQQDSSNLSLVASGFHEPCNVCEMCKRITNGSSLSCMEMDAASNRGIDDIRTLRERIGLAPAEGVMVVYIIDEVHMLTTEAFNALLKTLEEPPAHAVFILCTTDPEKIPDTVVSRCTQIQFQKASVEEVVGSLLKAVDGEKIQVNRELLSMIGARVDGSFRDGMKMLEQLAQSGKEIVKEMVDEITGHSEGYDPHPLIAALLLKDADGALKILAAKQALGVDWTVYAKRLVEAVRDRLLSELSGNNRILQEEIIVLAEDVEAAAVQIRRSTIPILPLEIMTAKWCLQHQETSHPPLPKASVGASKTPEKQEVAPPVAIKLQPPKDAFTGSLNDISSRWHEVLMAVRPLNHSLEGVLRSARPLRFEDGWLTVEAFYKFHKERLEQDRHRRLLEIAIGNLLGGAIQLRFVLGEKAALSNDPQVENISAATDDDELVKAAEEALLTT